MHESTQKAYIELEQWLCHDDNSINTVLGIIGSRALSFSDPYFHFECLSVRHSFCHSVILSVCPQLRS